MGISNCESAYAIGEGRLYIAPGYLTEAQLRNENYFAGESEGGCRLKYTAKTFPIKDINGNVVSTLRYGEKTVISGKLKNIDIGVLSALTGCPVKSENNKNTLLLGDKNEAESQISALLVCPLPEDNEFAVLIHGCGVSGIDMKLSAGLKSEAAFEITADSESGQLWIGPEGELS